jgi:hypothetical protein
MNREDYLRELEVSGLELKESLGGLLEAANPVAQLRAEVSRDWKWWLPGSAAAGLLAALVLRAPRRSGGTVLGSKIGLAFWVPTLLKLLPGVVTQLAPLFLSLRSGRKP